MRREPLPSGWAWTTIGDVSASIRNGLSTAPAGSAGTPILRISAVRPGRVDLDDVRFIERDGAELDPYVVDEGDVLFTRYNGSIAFVGVAACVPALRIRLLHPDKLIRVRVRRDLISPRFLAFAANCGASRRFVEGRIRTTAGQAGISGGDIRAVPLPLPPRAAQDAIVAAIEQHLSDIDAGVAWLRRVQANLKRYRASILKAACEGKLVPTEAELARKAGRSYESGAELLKRILVERRARWEADELAKLKLKGKAAAGDGWKKKYTEPTAPETKGLPALPEGWCWTSIDALTSLVTSGSRGWGDRYSSSGPLFIRAQDIKTDRLVLENVARVDLTGAAEGTRTLVAESDILITITGANVTKAGLVRREIEEAYVSQHVALVRVARQQIAPFVFTWVLSPAHGRGDLLAAAYGAGKPGLNLENVRTLLVALPPEREQARIVDEVARLMSVAEDAERVVQQQLARAARLRQAVLRDAFEGKLVPQDHGVEAGRGQLEAATRRPSLEDKTNERSRKRQARAEVIE